MGQVGHMLYLNYAFFFSGCNIVYWFTTPSLISVGHLILCFFINRCMSLISSVFTHQCQACTSSESVFNHSFLDWFHAVLVLLISKAKSNSGVCSAGSGSEWSFPALHHCQPITDERITLSLLACFISPTDENEPAWVQHKASVQCFTLCREEQKCLIEW